MTADAPTPPPHTPMAFLKGGAAGLFSARCADLISRAGHDIADFGSYDHVDKQIEAAKKKCNLWQDFKFGLQFGMTDEEKAPRQRELDKWRAKNPPPKRPPPPTPRERRLSGCQSGHLVMNSSYQRERKNPCTSIVDGFDDNLAPCMPHGGSTAVFGLEHHWVYKHEIAQPRDRGLRPEGEGFAGCTDPAVGQRPPVAPHLYRAADIDADEEARIRNNPYLRREPEGTLAIGAPGPSGAGAASAAPAPPSGAGDPSSPAGASGSSTPLWQKEITGERAVDCINNFRKAAMAAMKDHCYQSLAQNESDARGGDMSKTPAAYQDEIKARLAAAEAAGDKKKVGEERSALKKAVHANCRAAMGRRLAPGGTPQVDARCPAGSAATTAERSFEGEIPGNVLRDY